MQALVWTAPETMEMQTRSLPVPGENEVLLEVAAVGVCGSELSGYLGHNSLRVPPLIMGHEFSARIVKVGGGELANGAAPAVGQRVVVNPLVACGACVSCAAGLPNLCLRRQVIGAHRAGAFARYVAVPTAQCWLLSEHLSDAAGALVEPLACAVRAVRHAQWLGAEPLLILGAGAIGLCCLAVARAQSSGAIVITDRVAERLRLGVAWGATVAIDGGAADAQAHLRAALPHGAIAVIDAVGADITRALALSLVRPGGRIVYIGLHNETSPLAANYLVRQEVAIQGSFAYTPDDFAYAIKLLEQGVVRPSPDWVEHRPLHDGAAAFAGLINGEITIPKIMLRPA
ncbi:MAG TPA: galactitol-1-phosphate 5-dehydrogenase [Chloroflexi bacterium]|nr:galactitol-1-phosphate 5-dehydrogenase [Chloroflexota bacterium]HHW86187.1 alcohol dehydrogenase catalytic domain-containing protein [Chloroflexota bacterium]